MTKVVALRKTCHRWPSQWEGETDDGRGVYVRYRWGWLTVQVSETPGGDALDAPDMVEKQVGGEMDGEMSYNDLRRHAPEIEWPEKDRD